MTRRTSYREPEGRVERTCYYRLSQAVLRPLFRLYFRHKTRGLEHVPGASGAVVATNHASNLDPVLVGLDLPRPLFIMAKKSLHDLPVFGPFIRAYHSFPVRRGQLDRTAMRTAVRVLEEGNLVLMFPEGTRTRDGELQEPHSGVGRIVHEAGCPVVPGYIHGSFEAMKAGSWFPRPARTATCFGEPLTFDDPGDEVDRRTRYRTISEAVMDSIRSLKQQYTQPSQEVT